MKANRGPRDGSRGPSAIAEILDGSQVVR
jgi:hypothetical protein